MNQDNYTSSFTVAQSPDTVFQTIVAVRDWWGSDIDGSAEQVGDAFGYRVAGIHYSRQQVTELVPGRRVAWHVLESDLSFIEDKQEWAGTDIVFDIVPHGTGAEVRLTHIGLTPQQACFTACSQGWDHFFGECLLAAIARQTLDQPVSVSA